MALEWIRDNAVSFGGDSSRITGWSKITGICLLSTLCNKKIFKFSFRVYVFDLDNRLTKNGS
jgi:hypothetical protein